MRLRTAQCSRQGGDRTYRSVLTVTRRQLYNPHRGIGTACLPPHRWVHALESGAGDAVSMTSSLFTYSSSPVSKWFSHGHCVHRRSVSSAHNKANQPTAAGAKRARTRVSCRLLKHFTFFPKGAARLSFTARIGEHSFIVRQFCEQEGWSGAAILSSQARSLSPSGWAAVDLPLRASNEGSPTPRPKISLHLICPSLQG